ncbi:hypothetical protein CR513_51887, partial [Mucuna pruriens]
MKKKDQQALIKGVNMVKKVVYKLYIENYEVKDVIEWLWDMNVDKEEEGKEIMTILIIMKRVINPLEVVEKEEKSNVECYNCHKFGHFSGECRTNVKERVNLVGHKDVEFDEKNVELGERRRHL